MRRPEKGRVWRRWESNPRPKAFNSRIYMLSRFHFSPEPAIENDKGTSSAPPDKFSADSPEEMRRPKSPLI